MSDGAAEQLDAQPESVPERRQRFGVTVGRLTVVNAIFTLSTLVTGPLLARALGPDGRGSLAAILVPVGFAVEVSGLGLNIYAQREVARGQPVKPILVTLGIAMFTVGLLGAALADPIASLLAQDREVVDEYLRIGFALLPVALLTMLFTAVAAGLERWRLWSTARLVPPLATLAGLAVVLALDAMDVASAALVTLLAGIPALVPAATVAWKASGAADFQFRMVRDAFRFGSRAWLGRLGQLTNQRVDQIFMAALLPPRTLGLYAVAFSIAGFSSMLTAALSQVLLVRVSAGEANLVARSVRVLLAVVFAGSVVLALLTVPLLHILFGSAFADAAPLVWLLLLAGLPFAALPVLGSALTASGAPGRTAVGELTALAITIPALLLVLEPLGGVGAALVSLVAYSVNFAILLASARRRFGGKRREWMLVHTGDLRWLAQRLHVRRRPWETHSK